MRAEIIAVGTELLLGQTVNTNATYISAGLAELGIDVYFQTVVGDNAARIVQAIEIARQRADLIVFTGGLGPTQDDLTKDALAGYLNRGIHIHEPSMVKIEALFSSRGIHMVESNRRQANQIEDSDPLENSAGLAVGNALLESGMHYVLLPGPPREMKPMFDGPAKAWLRSVMGEQQTLFSRLLKFAGIGESSLEQAIIDLIDSQSDPTIAPYAKEGEVAIRLSTKAVSLDEAVARLDIAQQQIKQRVGQYLFATEDIPLEEAVLRLLRVTGRRFATAESLTGGMLAELVTSLPGSSGEFVGGVVTYTNDMKHKLLGIPLAQLEGTDAPGAISESTAAMMAERVRELTDCDFGLSLTGVAGPSEAEGKPVGTVFFGIAERGKPTVVHKAMLSGNRDIIRLRSAKAILYRFWRLLSVD
ncbi:competence/damage-inducible protein A [Paenibacillus nasutitermitis]|uniref:Putative competence-damage inducible protein n=1 Tax=Paenibacillus nasutitermitis TaxID=1652958 RepID=A0A916YZ03_9BACL|nr:competence/damage-inducible protein A [Paenibacillus nasutitermitis]GGD67736.1 putative competence-damage inducible protein [Paenibacillus nasutitermitis]